MKILIAVTGASGAIYAKILLEKLKKIELVGQIALIFSENGKKVYEYELGAVTNYSENPKIEIYDNKDMFSPPASGSASYDAMVVIPCSMGTLGRIASGTGLDLISRSADVMLKERRKLLLVTRETPLNTIHLRNMCLLSECGATIIPASPSFYSLPSTIEELCTTVIERVVIHLGFNSDHFEWGMQHVKG